MTRRALLRVLAALPASGLLAQSRPDSFRVYSESPRLLLRPQRLRLLRREKERRSLRWEQFETLWTAGAPFPELAWSQALQYRIADDRDAGTRAVAWAVGPADIAREADLRQMAIVADWCDALISRDDKTQLVSKLQRALADSAPAKTLPEARTKVFVAMALADAQPAAAEKALQSFFDTYWNPILLAPLRSAKAAIANPDAYALLEILHAFRDNLNFDLRDTYPEWFKQYPLLHLLGHYPAPWPDAENEFRIPADQTIEKTGPDVRKAALSRAAELAMVAYDSNAASSQLLQGWLTNDRFLMRGAYGIPYELIWANPYQPGLSYYHAPLALHDEIGGQLFVRSSWEDDASWAGFFGGQLQLFKDGSVTRMDPAIAREPLDLDTAIVSFARESKRFQIAARENDAAVFIVGLDPGRAYHIEVDGEEMVEEHADPGGIVFLPQVAAGGVRLGPVPAGL